MGLGGMAWAQAGLPLSWALAESGAFVSPLCPRALLQVVNVTGNQDICYYNFLCAHPLGNLRWGWPWVSWGGGRGLPMPGPGREEAGRRGRGNAPCVAPSSAFNNILSNLGYILLGLLFLLIILQREINHNRALLRNDLYALVREHLPAEGSAPAPF